MENLPIIIEIKKFNSTTNATAVPSNPASVTFSTDNTVLTSGTFEFTVNADGDVTIALARLAGVTARVTEIEVTTAAGEQGGEDGQATLHNFAYDFNTLAGVVSDASANTLDLTQADLTGANSWLTVVESAPEGSIVTAGKNLVYRGPNNNVIEIKNVALSFEVQGTATFKITLGSTGGSNLSAFAIMKADGTLVEGSVTGGTAIEAAEIEGVYYVTGTSKKDELTFSNLEAGTYYIVGVASGADDTLLEQNTGRNTRIYAMSLSDLY